MIHYLHTSSSFLVSGQQYQDFVLVQNLLDLAYTQIVTNQTLLPSDSIEDFLNIEYVSV